MHCSPALSTSKAISPHCLPRKASGPPACHAQWAYCCPWAAAGWSPHQSLQAEPRTPSSQVQSPRLVAAPISNVAQALCKELRARTKACWLCVGQRLVVCLGMRIPRALGGRRVPRCPVGLPYHSLSCKNASALPQ